MNNNEVEIVNLPLNEIRANPKQPRTYFDEKELKSLAQSIIQYGVIQPIIVQPSPIFGYEIIAGERRYRASVLAELSEIPAVVKRNLNESQIETIALLENIQRENLNPIEEALAYQNILKNQALTQEQLAEQIGKSRAYLTNMLRLLALPDEIKLAVKNQVLSNVQARTLLGLKEKTAQIALANRAVEEGLTVRQLEKIVKEQNSVSIKKKKQQNIFINDLEEQLKQQFGADISVKGNEKKGKIEFSYTDLDELNRIIDLLITKKD